jgi:hypothetical protein
MVVFWDIQYSGAELFLSAFIDQSTSDASRSSERARSFARVSACLSALEGILKGSSSFSPARRYGSYVIPSLSTVVK